MKVDNDEALEALAAAFYEVLSAIPGINHDSREVDTVVSRLIEIAEGIYDEGYSEGAYDIDTFQRWIEERKDYGRAQ